MSVSPLHELLHEVRVVHQRHRIVVVTFESIVFSIVATTLLRTALVIIWGVTSLLPFLFVFPVIGAIYVVLRFPPPLSVVGAARLVDQRLDLKDRLATAIEWQGKNSQLVTYLSDDAAMHARFAQTKDVLPAPKWFDRKRLWQWILILAAVLLWVIPLPIGLGIPTEYTSLSGTQKDDDGDPLLEEVDRLLQEIRALSPQIEERLQRDLSELKVGLRDRSLPQEDAASLLRHLEKRVESALANQQTSLEQGLPTERGDTLQFDHGSPTSFQSTGEPQRLQVVQNRQEIETIQVEWDEEAAAPQPDGEQSSETEGDQSGHGGGSPFPDLGDSGPESHEALDVSEATEDEISGTGSLAGHGPGDGSETESFERPGGTRILERLQGDTQSGPIHLGNIQLVPDTESSSSPVARAQFGALTIGEDVGTGVPRERIPFTHRDLVRRYFEHLEPEI